MCNNTEHPVGITVQLCKECREWLFFEDYEGVGKEEPQHMPQ
jgi:hypothetical protein